MNGKGKVITGLFCAGALALAMSAAAHPGGGPGTGPGGGYGMGGGYCGGPGGARGNPAAMAEARLAYLKAELKITAAQENAWNAFATTARARAEEMSEHREGMFASSGTAPERATQHAEFMKQRVAAMEASATALKNLYAVLTPEQKAIADGLVGPGSGHGWGRMGMRGGF